jgi:hypothetical protein
VYPHALDANREKAVLVAAAFLQQPLSDVAQRALLDLRESKV